MLSCAPIACVYRSMASPKRFALNASFPRSFSRSAAASTLKSVCIGSALSADCDDDPSAAASAQPLQYYEIR